MEIGDFSGDKPTKAGLCAIIGKPNAGKSTALNAVLAEKLSIVSEKPQTTRKKVVGVLTLDNKQVVFYDNPGLINPRYELQKRMMDYVAESVADADLILIVVDVVDYIKKGEFTQKKYLEALKESGKPIIIALNKVDLLADKKSLLPLIDNLSKSGVFDEIIPISALKNENMNALVDSVMNRLPESPFYYDPEFISYQSQRFFVSELIREKVYEKYRQEIPYSTEVNIREFKEREKGKWFISADIIAERKSQKGIILGEKGSKIKELGADSREAVENFLGRPVYLELFVKIRDKWRDNKNMLRSFGY